jgi:hypothetical protein
LSCPSSASRPSTRSRSKCGLLSLYESGAGASSAHTFACPRWRQCAPAVWG